jgi:PTH1 family peptidyl-tRNA hydrolase
LAQPQTYMNRSGWAVECLVDTYAVAADRLLVAFDDVALPLGALRLRPRGGPGGHRGIESVVDSLRSEEVPRLRLGIAPQGGAESLSDLPSYVLAPFDSGEREAVEALLERAVGAAEAWRLDGIETAMNRWNG